MSVYCQKAADETPSGEACERMQCASNRFRQEADELAIADMSITRLWSKKPR